MNINSILNKSFNELTPDDCVAINNYLLDRMLIELQKKDRSGIYGITQRESAFNSNRIEGSRLSKEQTASLFNTGTIMSDGEIYRANGYPIGEYKNRQNVVWDIDTVKPNQVHEKMSELLETYHNSEKCLTDITQLHVEYEKIHPFQDGNVTLRHRQKAA